LHHGSTLCRSRLILAIFLAVLVESSARVGATLRVLGDGQLIHSQAVRLQPGANRFLVPVQASAAALGRTNR